MAIAQVFGSAMNGRSKDRQELAATAIPLEARLGALPVRGGETFLGDIFGPLGYTVEANRLPLDAAFPEWGESPYFAGTNFWFKSLHEASLGAICRCRSPHKLVSKGARRRGVSSEYSRGVNASCT